MVFSMVFAENRFAGLPEKAKSPFVLIMSFRNWLKLVLNVDRGQVLQPEFGVFELRHPYKIDLYFFQI